MKFYTEGACFEYFAGGRVTSIYNCFCFTRLFENKNSVVYSTANLVELMKRDVYLLLNTSTNSDCQCIITLDCSVNTRLI